MKDTKYKSVRVMVSNVTFNNITVIQSLSVLVEDTGIPGENHRPATSQ